MDNGLEEHVTLHAAAKQALEALQEYQSKGAPFWACDSAVVALQAALSQPVPQDFDSWWDSGQQSDNNPFSMETPIYWAYEGYQAARRSHGN
jgi:hypothetical protein